MQNKFFSVEFRPRFRDTDRVGHINNSVFLTYLEIARSEWYYSLRNENDEKFFFILARAEINYINPIQLGSNLLVKMWTERIGNKSWTFAYLIEDKDNSKIYAKAKTVQVAYNYQNNESVLINEKIRSQLLTISNS